MAKYILSIDGGGMRGIMPALILAEVEKRCGKPVSEIFHLMAGTSTGGIVVAGLTVKGRHGPKYKAEDLADLYRKHGPYIFKSSLLRRSMSWFNRAQYPHENIETVLEEYFSDAKLKDSITNVLLTSYDIHNNCPFFFKSWKEDRNSILVKDALRATTAAPTYFIPKSLKIHTTERVLVDGGVFANNPSACAYATSKRLFPNDDIVILSLGTGRTDRRIENARKLGRIEWIMPLLDVVFASGLDCVNYQMNKIMGDKYIRIQTQISAEMDDATPESIRSLEEEAEAMIEKNQEAIARLCDV
ncbi:patatin-like protein 5 [Cimex lectularius]|uniref:PNPLA domain-containing protein n=1 Tax=Cimex lectularius TaxID=79782 RepID=A0A8I6SP13_CIMLE|nr:patatin-like protein 5 [Cimex lectularius]